MNKSDRQCGRFLVPSRFMRRFWSECKIFVKVYTSLNLFSKLTWESCLLWTFSQRDKDAAATVCTEKGVGGSSQLHLWAQRGLHPPLPGTEGCHVSLRTHTHTHTHTHTYAHTQTSLPCVLVCVGWACCATTPTWPGTRTCCSPSRSSSEPSWLFLRPASSTTLSSTPSRDTSASVSGC